MRVCSGAKDTGDDEGFLLVSLVARAAGWKLCGTEEEGRAVRLAGFTDDAWSERFAGANSLAGSVRFASGRNPWTAWFFCVLMTE